MIIVVKLVKVLPSRMQDIGIITFHVLALHHKLNFMFSCLGLPYVFGFKMAFSSL